MNAPSPIEVTLLGMVILVKFSQPKNAESPIDFGLFGIVTEEIFVLSANAYAQEREVTVRVNNFVIESPVPAQIVNDRTMLPARFVAEALGAEVSWNDEKREVKIPLGFNKFAASILPSPLPAPTKV